MATHSSILAWKTPWTEEPGGLQSTGLRESDTTQQLNDSSNYSVLEVPSREHVESVNSATRQGSQRPRLSSYPAPVTWAVRQLVNGQPGSTLSYVYLRQSGKAVFFFGFSLKALSHEPPLPPSDCQDLSYQYSLSSQCWCGWNPQDCVAMMRITVCSYYPTKMAGRDQFLDWVRKVLR